MPQCSILVCKNRSMTQNRLLGGITYHRFPREPFVKEEWIKATGRLNWWPSKASTICSDHFLEDDFIVKKSGNKYIKTGAVPRKNILIHRALVGVSKNETSNVQSEGGTLTERNSLNINILPNSSECPDGEKENEESAQIVGDNTCTDREKKLKHLIECRDIKIKQQALKIKALEAKNRRLKKKIASLQEVLDSIEKQNFMNTEHLHHLQNINLTVQELITRQTLNEKSGFVTKQQYSQALRTFALTLHYYSPKAYEYVRETFDTCLPHPQTLKKWYSKVGGDPGFTTEAFEALKLKTKNTKYLIVGTLILDEMAIRRRIEWDGQRLHGYVNLGTELEGDHLEEAKEALVFLVTAINSNFKVPVGYYLVDGVSGLQRAALVKQCLELLHETGIRIVALTFDGSASNISMTRSLGCDIETGHVTFPHPVTQAPVVTILDPCHMIKLIRNSLQSYKIIIDQDNNRIEWKFLQELNKIQEYEKFHMTNKLTYHHINYDNQRMKVKLATQLFSARVADAIRFCREDLKMAQFQGSEATEKFILIVNNLFDILNSKNLHQFGYKKALNETNCSEILNYLNAASNYLSGLKTENGLVLTKSSRKIGFVGFLGCMIALKTLYDDLVVTEKVLKYLPFYKMSQDHIELFFGNIRSHGGANNNPTARQFAAAYKKILIHVELKDFGNGNCTALENISILNCSSAIDRINKTSGPNILDEDLLIEDNEEITLYNMSEFSIQVIAYIAGCIARNLLKHIKCDVCVSALVTNQTTEEHKFIIAKNKGGLMFPSSDVIKICKAAESVVRSLGGTIFKKEALILRVMKMFIGTNIFGTINFHQIDEYPSSNHVTDLMKAVVEKYVNIRIRHILKSRKKISKRQFLNKYVLFEGQ